MFSEKLKQSREKTGLSQIEAAERIKIAPSSYSAYETGRQLPRMDVIQRICKEFHISADWLLDIEKPENPIKTYRHCVEMIERLRAITSCSITPFKIYNVDNSKGLIITVYDETLCDFFKDENNLFSALDPSTLTRELYFVWFENRLKQLEEPFKRKNRKELWPIIRAMIHEWAKTNIEKVSVDEERNPKKRPWWFVFFD